jgi:hypothetical protein
MVLSMKPTVQMRGVGVAMSASQAALRTVAWQRVGWNGDMGRVDTLRVACHC